MTAVPEPGNPPMHSEIRLQFAQTAGGIGLWEWDVGTGQTWWSPMMYELLALPAGDGTETDQHFFDHVHPDDRDWLIPHLQEAVAHKAGFDREFRIIRADGHERWITGRGQCLIDGRGSAMRMLGDRAFLFGGEITPGMRLQAQAAIRAAQESGTPIRLSLPLKMADGAVRDIAWSIAVDSENQRLFCVGRDMTEMQKTQRLLRDAEQRLAQLQQVETLGQLASGVAHDFNNLLVPILSVLDLLKRRPQGDADFDQLIEGANHAALSAREMVRRMLSFAQQRQGKAERVSIGGLLEGLRDLITHVLPPSITLDILCEDGLPPILIDANQLELAIVNLATNARDAMPDGGYLMIVARSESPNVVIEIIDNGTGMDAETCARASQAFYTTKPDGKGTGLGLFMAARLAERYAGNLTIDSKAGEGTTVRLAFPAMNAS